MLELISADHDSTMSLRTRTGDGMYRQCMVRREFSRVSVGSQSPRFLCVNGDRQTNEGNWEEHK